MKKKSIFLCSSMSFYPELLEIEKQLFHKGFTVHIPVSAQKMKQTNDFDVSHFKRVFTPKQKGIFIHQNFEQIAKSDAILVINNSKNGIDGYIGANVLMEIGLAFYFKKNIFVWNSVSTDAPYYEELIAVDVKEMNQDIDKIQTLLN